MRRKAPADDPAVLGALHEAARHQQTGDLAKAEAIYRQILKRHPDHPDALHLLGMVTHLMGDPGKAVDLIRRVIKRYPDFPEAHNTLGNILKDQGDTAGAVVCYRKAVALRPEQVSAHYNLGNCYRDTGNLEQASAGYRRALEIDPEYAQAHNALGGVLHDQGKLTKASACFRRALEIKPHYAEALNDFGLLLKDRRELAAAIQCFERALAIKPKYAEANNNLGGTLQDHGKLNEAVHFYKTAVALKPGYASAHSNLIFCMNYDPAYTADDIWVETLRWGRLYGSPEATLSDSYANDPDPRRRLRIGYVSPDFRAHSVSYFFEPLLEAHEQNVAEIYCYAEVRSPDETTERLKTLADHWRSTVGHSDAEIAERIQADGIDILVDLAGHTRNNRLGVFALKPAPVQVTWLGYPGTTGLPTIDYRFTDIVADPPGEADDHASEELIRLSRGFHCYGAPADAPEVGEIPALKLGFVTFGSCNNLAKVTPEVVETWAQVISEVPDSRMLIKCGSFADAMTQQRFREMFAAQGIASEALEFAPGIFSLSGHLGFYGRIDIALDTFPYNGTTTTCEALWMGVPVLTLLGNRHAGRVGASLLTHLGLPELIAETVDSYVAKTAELASDLDRLAELRAGLRPRMQASSMCDRAGFARDIETAYRDIWRRWCESV